jgi:hypothetical protein
MGGPFKDALNNTAKYIASRSPRRGLVGDSTLLHGDIATDVGLRVISIAMGLDRDDHRVVWTGVGEAAQR